MFSGCTEQDFYECMDDGSEPENNEDVSHTEDVEDYDESMNSFMDDEDEPSTS